MAGGPWLTGGWFEFFFPVFRMKKMMPRITIAITTTPPTAPPTMAPMGVDVSGFDEVAEGAGMVVLDVGGVVLDFDAPAVLALALRALEVLRVLDSEASREWYMS